MNLLLETTLFCTLCQNGQIENADFSDIADFISPTFINPCFRYSPIANIENLDLKKSEIFKHPCFRYSPYIGYRKHGCLKISDFFKSQFSIFTRQMSEKTSVFSIFIIGEYRKHGCSKVSDFLNLSFRYSLWVNIENTDL